MMVAGKYYVGDLCYVLHDEWDEFCELTIASNSVADGEFSLKDGRKFATYSTAYGDGVYDEFSVDAGLIGCILLEDIDLEDSRNSLDGGKIVDFDTAFTTYSEDGLIIIGHIVIDTVSEGYGYDEEFPEDESYDDEE